MDPNTVHTRRITGLETEFGITSVLDSHRRLGPDEVARYVEEDGAYVPLFEAAACQTRGSLLRAYHEECALVTADAVHDFVLRKTYAQQNRTVQDFECILPYGQTTGTPFLYPQEQYDIRVRRHFWAQQQRDHPHPYFAHRIARCDFLLHYREDSADAPRIRQLRYAGRLGMLRQVREVVSPSNTH